MPLSDHEQRLLEQMERALYAEDPKFADSLRKTRRASIDRKRLLLGTIAALVGLAVIVVGVATSLPALGLLGFVATVAGAFVAYNAYTAKAATDTTAAGAPAPQAPRAAAGGGFMERLEERWRRRRDERGQY